MNAFSSPRPKKNSPKSPDAFFGSIADRLLLTEILLAPGGERLSFECAQIFTVLAMTELDGLYRSGGKREFDRNSPEGLRKSVSHCHDVNQKLIRANDQMQREFNLKLRNAIVLAIVGWVPAIAAFLYTVLR